MTKKACVMRHPFSEWRRLPSGYLHLGHAFSGMLNFSTLARESGGRFGLRIDDSIPAPPAVPIPKLRSRKTPRVGGELVLGTPGAPSGPSILPDARRPLKLARLTALGTVPHLGQVCVDRR